MRKLLCTSTQPAPDDIPSDYLTEGKVYDSEVVEKGDNADPNYVRITDDFGGEIEVYVPYSGHGVFQFVEVD